MNSFLDPLLAVLQSQIHASYELLQAMEAELEALKRRDAAMLEQAVERKSKTVDVLREASDAHAALMSSRGLDMNASGMQNYLSAVAPVRHDALSQAWSELRDIASQVFDHNRVNGQVIKLGHDMTEQLLHALRGEDKPASLYGPNGAVPAARSSRPLAQA